MTLGQIIGATKQLTDLVLGKVVPQKVIKKLEAVGHYQGIIGEYARTEYQIIKRNKITGKLTFYTSNGNSDWRSG